MSVRRKILWFLLHEMVAGVAVAGALAALGVSHAAYWRSGERDALPPFAFAFAAGACGVVIAFCGAWLARDFGQPWMTRWVTGGGSIGPLAGLLMAMSLTVGAIRRRRRDRARQR